MMLHEVHAQHSPQAPRWAPWPGLGSALGDSAQFHPRHDPLHQLHRRQKDVMLRGPAVLLVLRALVRRHRQGPLLHVGSTAQDPHAVDWNLIGIALIIQARIMEMKRLAFLIALRADEGHRVNLSEEACR
jgi:hypothetical protein